MTAFTPAGFSAMATLCASAAAVFDVRARRIPNWLVSVAIVVAVTLHAAFQGSHGLLSSLSAAALGGGLFLLAYVLGGMGAGDVKLMFAVCALAGWPDTPSILILTALAGGVMAVAVAIHQQRVGTTFRNVAILAHHHAAHGAVEHAELNVRNESTLRLPYGLAIAAGCLLSFMLQIGKGI